jgi:hypothetical protein
MKKIISNWTLVRITRLGLGIYIVFSSILNNQLVFSLVGLILIYQALVNAGCCPNSNCNIEFENDNNK